MHKNNQFYGLRPRTLYDGWTRPIFAYIVDRSMHNNLQTKFNLSERMSSLGEQNQHQKVRSETWWRFPIHLIVFISTTPTLVITNQCDLIGRFLKVLGYKFSNKSGPNIWQLSRLLRNAVKTPVELFGHCLELLDYFCSKIWSHCHQCSLTLTLAKRTMSIIMSSMSVKFLFYVNP